MDVFSGLEEFEQLSKPNNLVEEETQLFSHQSFFGEPVEAELQNDTIAKENHLVESCQNEVVCVDSLSNKPVNVGLRFKDGVENQGEGSYISVDNPIDEPLETSNLIVDDVLVDGVDVSSKFEDDLENHVEGAHLSGQCEQAGFNENAISKTVSERANVSLKIDNPIDKPAQNGDAISDSVFIEGVDVIMTCEQPEPKEEADLEAEIDNSKLEQNVESRDDKVDSSQVEGARISMVEPMENMRVVVLAVSVDSCEKTRQAQKPKATPVKMKSPKQLSVASARVLRSRSKDKHEDRERSADLETSKGRAERSVKKKGKANDVKSNDEFAKMRKHLKYLLHKISYEQSYLDAYSNEGWRGQSLEKLRPEKELQRAKADINRLKLKIRDLFHRIDSMLSEGKFPESLYDSDGLIDSEDIFCAKCGTKNMSPGNDILLCDGICDRGFHQKCLNPPLPTEEIPPGDEGWLCPACDCKVDCYDLLNDSHGTKLTIEDSWEEVFPEVVASAVVSEIDDLMGLPSDDSEDNEYNPDGPNDDANSEGNESSSNESGSDESDSSDFSSASEDLGPICGPESNLRLPSDDDSEDDDDFNPDAPNVNEDGVEIGSSGSDFTSASEDLGRVIGGEGISEQGVPLPLVLDQNLGESELITGKRCAERLDYKKLYDETYGNAASDSSDDEDWTDMVPKGKRKNKMKIANCASASANGTCGSGSPRRKSQPKVNRQAANGSTSQLQENSLKTNSDGTIRKRPPLNKLGEAVTKRLYESFKDNQYPDRETKEKLANEVGLTLQRVDKWFGNARWSLRHHPSQTEVRINRAISSSTAPLSVASNGVETTKTKKLTSRRTREIEGNQSMPENSLTENSKEGTQVDPLQANEITQGRGLRKRRKSCA